LSKDLITGSKIDAIPHLEKIGTNYGGWITPIDLIKNRISVTVLVLAKISLSI
jgi:hypothetical protein